MALTFLHHQALYFPCKRVKVESVLRRRAKHSKVEVGNVELNGVGKAIRDSFLIACAVGNLEV